jgi:UDP-N-acetylglucosamine 2-epimerase (non-hydrolysing)
VTDLLVVVGARPNFMKAAPLVAATDAVGLRAAVVHTGQHYDAALSAVFFEELGLRAPDVYLGVGSGSHAAQTAEIMIRFEPELRRLDPRLVVVVGDVNSTLACSLVAAKERYRVAHVEAGLRCDDFAMPEEINRRLTDRLSELLFTTSRDANENLRGEGIGPDGVHFVGNTMIDTLLRFRDAARRRDAACALGLERARYAVATLHRPENVDRPARLAGVLSALAQVGEEVPVVLPLHPRTRERVATDEHAAALKSSGILVTGPVGYLDFLSLVSDAALVLTDSGGVQEETTVLGVPCLTLRESTERPVTVHEGTNQVVGTDHERVVAAAMEVLRGPRRPGRVPELWDGQAGRRIAAILEDELGTVEVATVRA